MNELCGLLFLIFAAGYMPTCLAVLCVWSRGSKVTILVGTAIAALCAAASIHFVCDPPFFTIDHMFCGGLVFLSGIFAVRLMWLEKHEAALYLPKMEERVNKVLETQWACLDPKGAGFLSEAALRLRVKELEKDYSEEWRVALHIHKYFNDIAKSSEGTYILTPAVAHGYMAGVRHKYRFWMKQKRNKCRQSTVVI